MTASTGKRVSGTYLANAPQPQALNVLHLRALEWRVLEVRIRDRTADDPNYHQEEGDERRHPRTKPRHSRWLSRDPSASERLLPSLFVFDHRLRSAAAQSPDPCALRPRLQ